MEREQGFLNLAFANEKWKLIWKMATVDSEFEVMKVVMGFDLVCDDVFYVFNEC